MTIVSMSKDVHLSANRDASPESSWRWFLGYSGFSGFSEHAVVRGSWDPGAMSANVSVGKEVHSSANRETD